MIRPLKINEVQFGAKVGRHMLDFGRNPDNAADRKWLMDHIHDIYTNAVEFRDGTALSCRQARMQGGLSGSMRKTGTWSSPTRPTTS